MVQQTKFQGLIWLVKRTLTLDIKLLVRDKNTSFGQKLKFIFNKYGLMVKHFFVPYVFGTSSAKLNGRTVYYNNRAATYAGYQAIVTEHMHWFKQLNLSTAPVLIDIGANVGYVSTIFSDNYPNASIYAIEPSSKVFEVLKKNTQTYLNIKLFNIGLGDENKTIDMSVDKKVSVFSSITHKLSNEFYTEKIQIKTLDTFCAENDIEHIDILKLDVEGFELEVLKGAKKTFSKIKYLHMELNSKDYLLSDLCQVILGAGVKFNLMFIRNFSNNPDSLFLDGDVLLEIIHK